MAMKYGSLGLGLSCLTTNWWFANTTAAEQNLVAAAQSLMREFGKKPIGKRDVRIKEEI